jgi:MYXO-CTERM domain-containing protein
MRTPRSYPGLLQRSLSAPSAVAITLLLSGCSGEPQGASSTVSADTKDESPPAAPEQYGPQVDVAYPESSRSLREVVAEERRERRNDPREEETREREERDEAHPVGKIRPLPIRDTAFTFDSVLQSSLPVASMPVVGLNFMSQGNTLDPATEGGTPPDTNGAVGPNHYVQAVNTGLAIWDKSGHVVLASRDFNALWAGYTGTNTGNSCAANNDGDPVVIYDQLADRWFISQFALPNVNSGPNFQCVAVSKTPDPTGAYWLYDFQYSGMNDYGKFGIWPDAYYATFNMFNTSGGDSDFCAYDRVSMLQGKPATQQCFQQGDSVSGALPVSLDGPIPPPRGTPGYFVQLSDNKSLDLFKVHVDWAKPANSKVTGPTNIKVASYQPMCGNSGTCVPQPSPGNQLDSLSDRLMFRLTYRNFGTHDALMVNHSVDVPGAAGGIRWYEIRSPNGTPTVYQQGTYAPNDGSYRWMASLAQDQAEDMTLGFSISSAKQFPSIGWTGRFPTDAVGTMGQGESVIDTGKGVETGTFKDGTTATRWGDYSNLTVDPTDDCTFWYTQELYDVTGTTPRTWDTDVATVRFPRCAANDFSLGITPATQQVAPGGKVTFTLTTPKTKGTAEAIALAIQDLPAGVTGAFTPAAPTAGTTVTLTLTAAAGAAVTTSPVVFTVIGKAPSAVHMATADVSVGIVPIVDAGVDAGGTDHDAGIGPILDAGVDAGEHDAGVDAGPIDAGPTDASGTDASGTDAGGATDSGAHDSGADASGASDSGQGDDGGGDASIDASAPGNDAGPGDASVATDSGAGHDAGSTGSDAGARHDSGAGTDAAPPSGGGEGDGGSGDSSGCGCRTAGTSGGSSPWGLVFGLGAVIAAARRRRTSRGSSPR